MNRFTRLGIGIVACLTALACSGESVRGPDAGAAAMQGGQGSLTASPGATRMRMVGGQSNPDAAPVDGAGTPMTTDGPPAPSIDAGPALTPDAGLPPQCLKVAAACTNNKDCCDGLYCDAEKHCALPPPICVAAAGACQQSGDCCLGMVCDANKRCASPPPMCRQKGGGCNAAGDCCGGLTCLGNVCLPPPVCGDGACAVGESAANCCLDCACGGEQMCNRQSRVCETPSTSLRWTFDDGCRDGEDTYMSVFDIDNEIVYPNADEFWLIPDRESAFVEMKCFKGATLCFGGENDSGALIFGSGVDGDVVCNNCCVTCGAMPSFETRLTCP